MSSCYDGGDYGYGDADDLWATVESLCWQNGFNGTCPGYARSHEACGGAFRADGARACTELCESTTGAHIDDLDTLCSSDSDCDSYCDVEIDQAGESCGGVSVENDTCLFGWINDNDAWMCERALEARLAG
jgi:hypothetical protein